MHQRYTAVLSIVLIVLNGCSIVEKLNKREEPPEVRYEGPLLVAVGDSIPNVPAEVKFADFWIRQANNPDDILMTLADIDRFNADNPIRGSNLLSVIDLPEKSIGDNVRDYISANARYLADHVLYVTGDIQLENAERQRIIALMDTTRIPDVITLKYGVMLRHEMGKLWPTMIPLMSKPNDIEFDQGVVSAIDMCAPVALLHTSHDGRWSYIQHASFTAWIPSDAVAFGDTATVRMLTGRDDIVVAVGHSVSIYGTPESGAAVGAVQMGSYLRIDAIGNDYCSVLIPGRGETGELAVRKGFVRRDSNISLGFPPYTLRNVYHQCFVLYGRRYGWGGMYEERDCSQFVRDVFRCFGFILPRNSSQQANASTAVIPVENLSRETRLDALRNSPGGISLVGMPGHIMIYLGTYNGVPYCIHDFWSWREPATPELDVTHRVARVDVTDMLLGEGSLRGSFIDRVNRIAILGNYIIGGQ